MQTKNIKTRLILLAVVATTTAGPWAYSQTHKQTNPTASKAETYRKLDPIKDGFTIRLQSHMLEGTATGAVSGGGIDVFALGIESGIKGRQVCLIRNANMTGGKIDTKTYGVIEFRIDSLAQITEVRVTKDSVARIRAALRKRNPSKAVAAPVTPLKVSVASVAVATIFQVYVGGGTNISPPQPYQGPFGGGGGMPLISMSGGSTFLAGKVGATDSKTKLIKLEFSIDNSTEKPESFKIGDLSLSVAGKRASDFVAVGYGDRLCAMSDADRRTVKQIVVEVPPKAQRTVSYIFPLLSPEAKQGAIVLQHSPPVTFQIHTTVSNQESQTSSIPTERLGAAQESKTNQPTSAPTAPAARLEAAIKRIDAASALYEPKGYKFACIVATRKANENAIIGILKDGDYFKATPTDWRRLSVEEASRLPSDIKEDLNSLPKNPLVWFVNVDSLRDPAYGTQDQSLLNNARQALFGTLPGSVIFTLYPPDTPPDELETNGKFDPSKFAYSCLNYSVLSSPQGASVPVSNATTPRSLASSAAQANGHGGSQDRFSGSATTAMPLTEQGSTPSFRSSDLVKEGISPIGNASFTAKDGTVYSILELDKKSGRVYLASPSDKVHKVLVSGFDSGQLRLTLVPFTQGTNAAIPLNSAVTGTTCRITNTETATYPSRSIGYSNAEGRVTAITVTFVNDGDQPVSLNWKGEPPVLRSDDKSISATSTVVPNRLPMAGGVNTETSCGVAADEGYNIDKKAWCEWLAIGKPGSGVGDHISVPIKSVSVTVRKASPRKVTFLFPGSIPASGVQLRVPGCRPVALTTGSTSQAR